MKRVSEQVKGLFKDVLKDLPKIMHKNLLFELLKGLLRNSPREFRKNLFKNLSKGLLTEWIKDLFNCLLRGSEWSAKNFVNPNIPRNPSRVRTLNTHSGFHVRKCFFWIFWISNVFCVCHKINKKQPKIRTKPAPRRKLSDIVECETLEDVLIDVLKDLLESLLNGLFRDSL